MATTQLATQSKERVLTEANEHFSGPIPVVLQKSEGVEEAYELNVSRNELKWVQKLQEQKERGSDERAWVVSFQGNGRGLIHAMASSREMAHIGVYRFEGEEPSSLDILKALVKTGFRKRPSWVMLPYSIPWLEAVLPSMCGIRVLHWKYREDNDAIVRAWNG